ncbi:MAG: tRNA pseudouridine(55) synthase TruB [Candidatus Pacebacteria bacterium]|nr:tRNA pseudouridine(55) synthase TruB [Candidatus Paceibacterota bacterium]
MKDLIAVNKPKGPSSNQFLSQLRRLLNTKKIGHAGTLDPLASGVLVVGIGREATKQLPLAVGGEKEYLAEIVLGKNSTTDDEEGEKTVITETNNLNIDKEKIAEVLLDFQGVIWQQPPIFSALKIKGTPAYKLARRGEIESLPKRQVEIKTIEIIDFTWPKLEIKVVCLKGVYIRSLARDIGEKLNCGAYLGNLIRTRVGQFKLEDSLSLEQVQAKYLQDKKKKSNN